MKSNELIIRALGNIERSQEDNSRRISGQAIIYNSLSRNLGGFVEIINEGAISEELLAGSDVIMNIDHDDSRMLARYRAGEGTLSLELRNDGLYFSFDAPETALGDEVLYNVRNGNLFECSFKALVAKEDVKRDRYEDGYIQIINKISTLLDCSIVVHAAYPATDVYSRDLEEAKAQFDEIKREIEEKEAAEKAEQEKLEEEQRKQEILDNLNSLKINFLEEIK